MSSSLLQSRLRSVIRDIERFDNDYSSEALQDDQTKLQEQLEAVRSQGYAFLGEVQTMLQTSANQIAQLGSVLQQQARNQQSMLRFELGSVERAVGDAQDDDEGSISAAESRLDNLERKVKQAQRELDDMMEPVTKAHQTARRRLSDIQRYLTAQEEASFDFDPDEKLVLADKAEWVVTGKGRKDPDGILFLTDKRVLFEQKETTGKTLGLFGGKKEHELEWAVPLDQITGVEAENKGMMGGKDMLMLTLAPGAEHESITVEIKGGVDNEYWREMLHKAQNGELGSATSSPSSSGARIVHYMMREKGANTGEAIHLEFDVDGKLQKVSAFRRGSGTKEGNRFSYPVVLQSGDTSQIIRTHKTASGLASSMVMTQEFDQLAQALGALGWQQGETTTDEKNHGWGNMETTVTTHFQPGDSTDSTPTFPPPLLDQLLNSGQSYQQEIMAQEQPRTADWEQIIVEHKAQYFGNERFFSETLIVNGYGADGERQTFNPKDYNGWVGHAIVTGGAAQVTWDDMLYEGKRTAPMPAQPPTPQTAYLFMQERLGILERLQSYGFRISDTQETFDEERTATYTTTYTLRRA